MSYTLLYICGLLILISSCNKPLYNQEILIENKAWRYDQLLNFKWSISDTGSLYNIFLIAEHAIDVPHQNIYILCGTLFPNGQNKEQILSLELFDSAGKPYGNCNGKNCSTEIPLIVKIKFPQAGDYQLTVQQHGRDSVAKGFNSFEIRVSKFKEGS